MNPNFDSAKSVQDLLVSIKLALPDLKRLRDDLDRRQVYEDLVYRLYHQSWKIYSLQQYTLDIASQLQAIAPERPLSKDFQAIVVDGTGRVFEPKHNERWLEETRPIPEAFFHAKYFLEMVLKYGAELEFAPSTMPSGWAAVLYLYDLRHASE